LPQQLRSTSPGIVFFRSCSPPFFFLATEVLFHCCSMSFFLFDSPLFPWAAEIDLDPPDVLSLIPVLFLWPARCFLLGLVLFVLFTFRYVILLFPPLYHPVASHTTFMMSHPPPARSRPPPQRNLPPPASNSLLRPPFLCLLRLTSQVLFSVAYRVSLRYIFSRAVIFMLYLPFVSRILFSSMFDLSPCPSFFMIENIFSFCLHRHFICPCGLPLPLLHQLLDGHGEFFCLEFFRLSI